MTAQKAWKLQIPSPKKKENRRSDLLHPQKLSHPPGLIYLHLGTTVHKSRILYGELLHVAKYGNRIQCCFFWWNTAICKFFGVEMELILNRSFASTVIKKVRDNSKTQGHRAGWHRLIIYPVEKELGMERSTGVDIGLIPGRCWLSSHFLHMFAVCS